MQAVVNEDLSRWRVDLPGAVCGIFGGTCSSITIGPRGEKDAK